MINVKAKPLLRFVGKRASRRATDGRAEPCQQSSFPRCIVKLLSVLYLMHLGHPTRDQCVKWHSKRIVLPILGLFNPLFLFGFRSVREKWAVKVESMALANSPVSFNIQAKRAYGSVVSNTHNQNTSVHLSNVHVNLDNKQIKMLYK